MQVSTSGNLGIVPNVQMQYAQAIAFPTLHISYVIGPGPPGTDDVFVRWLDYMINLDARFVPKTILIPQGNSEMLFSREQAVLVCNRLATLGARGVSVLVTSGNNGVGQGGCKDRTGKARFLPPFPSTCKWGLFFSSQVVHKRRYGSLTTRPRFRRSLGHFRRRNDWLFARSGGVISGAGFSDYFVRPDYQQEAVSSFLHGETLENEYQGMYKCVCIWYPI